MTVTSTPSTSPAAPAGVPALPGTAAAAGTVDPAAAGFAALVAGLLEAHGPAAVLPGAPAPAGPSSSPADPPEPAEAEETSTDPPADQAAPIESALAGLAVVGLRVPVVTDPADRALVDAPPTRGPAGGLPGPVPGADLEGGVGEPVTPSPAPTSPVPGSPSPTVSVDAAPAAPTAPTDLRATGPTGPQPPSTTQQVLPEVTRLVSRGDGTHRLTLTLEPEALGEVRVTLTVRHGEVHVRLAAGEQAQQALLEGTPELRRVLELAGATETRVVVRDLQAPAPSGQSSTAYPAAHEGRGDTGAAGHGPNDTDDHHAGTRGGSTARDGASDGAPPPRPDPVVLAPSSGVDMTM